MKADVTQYRALVKKLVEKTRQGRVHWERPNTFGETRYASGESFKCDLGSEGPDSFSFEVGRDGSQRWLLMTDKGRNEIFHIYSNDLPTSPDEEDMSTMIEELYDLARWQALNIGQKLGVAATLLDQV